MAVGINFFLFREGGGKLRTEEPVRKIYECSFLKETIAMR